MSISKSICKNIWFFIIIFIFLINIPLKVSAAEQWYYATTPEDSYAYAADIHGNSFTTSKKCNDDRTARIEKDIIEQKTYSITICVKLNKKPPVKGSELGVPFVPLQDTVEKWWFEYLNNGTKTYYVLGPYTSQKKCEDKWREVQQSAVSNGSLYSLNKACFKSNTEPSATPPIDSVQLPGNNPKQQDPDTTYSPLAPLPDGTGGLMTAFDTKDPCPFGKYLNILIKLFIGIAAVLSMIMIVMGGIEYMTTGLVSSKEAAKHKITNAILGLILALGSYAILNTLNPKLLEVCLNNLPEATITISSEDTSTGSSTSLCLSSTPPNPDNAKGISMKSVMAKPAMPEYETEINKITSASLGKKYLATAQTAVEGFYPGSKSYRTKNPGNIGNTDDGKTKTFDTLRQGIEAQLVKVVSGQGSYKIGGSYKCALGNEKYDGSLYQYLRIYSTGARTTNNYVNYIIGFFADKGKTINARTKMSDIYNIK